MQTSRDVGELAIQPVQTQNTGFAKGTYKNLIEFFLAIHNGCPSLILNPQRETPTFRDPNNLWIAE